MAGEEAAGEEEFCDEVLCAVCEVPLKNSPSYRITRPACDACKKFFWRNRNTDLNSLACVTQYGECDVVGCVGPNSNVRRPICAHCRLAKCYAIGMQSKKATAGKTRKKRKATSSSTSAETATKIASFGDDRSSGKTSSSDDNEEASPSLPSGDEVSSSSSILSVTSTTMTSSLQVKITSITRLTPLMEQQQQQRSQTPLLSTLMAAQRPVIMDVEQLPFFIGDAENAELEGILRVTSQAVVELSPLQSMPWTLTYEPVENDVAMWTWAMRNVTFCIDHCFAFVQRLSEIADLPVSDRTHLFAASGREICVAQFALSRNPVTTIFGMNPPTRTDFLRYFPAFKSLEPLFDEMSLSFAAWNPDFLEFAVLQATLFFHVDLLHVLQRPDLVADANRRLSIAMTSLFRRSNQPVVKMQHFRRVTDLLRSFHDGTDNALNASIGGRSDLLQMNQLFSELHFTDAIDRCSTYHQPP